MKLCEWFVDVVRLWWCYDFVCVVISFDCVCFYMWFGGCWCVGFVDLEWIMWLMCFMLDGIVFNCYGDVYMVMSSFVIVEVFGVMFCVEVVVFGIGIDLVCVV